MHRWTVYSETDSICTKEIPLFRRQWLVLIIILKLCAKVNEFPFCLCHERFGDIYFLLRLFICILCQYKLLFVLYYLFRLFYVILFRTVCCRMLSATATFAPVDTFTCAQLHPEYPPCTPRSEPCPPSNHKTYKKNI